MKGVRQVVQRVESPKRASTQLQWNIYFKN